MNQTTAEVLILVINALGAGILLFVGGVVQKIMNDMDAPTFRWFLNKLDNTAMSNPFAVVVATLPVLLVIPYFVMYGFSHWWFTAGFVVWLLGSTITKVTNMPVYKWVGDANNTNLEELKKQRRQLQFGNTWRAWFTLASVLLMAAQFGPREAGVLVFISLAITYPLLWVANKYKPN